MRTNCCYCRIGIASITVGTNSNPNLYAVCKANIDRDGIFVCDTALTGTYVGLTRTAIGGSDGNNWHFSEIRAYPWVPFDELTSTLSADVNPNASLVYSVHINEPTPTGSCPSFSVGGIKTDDLFSTGPATNCYWMMNLGSSKHVKVVLIIGDYVTKANTQDWKLTVGNNPDPLLNP